MGFLPGHISILARVVGRWVCSMESTSISYHLGPKRAGSKFSCSRLLSQFCDPALLPWSLGLLKFKEMQGGVGGGGQA